MKIIYPYIRPAGRKTGGSVHVDQFVKTIESMGHQVITGNGDVERADSGISKGLIARIFQIRNADVVYYRIEDKPPKDRLHSKIIKKLVNNPLIIWEFNAVPEFSAISGATVDDISREKLHFRKNAKYCGLAICVSKDLAHYVHHELGIKRVKFVPNGSDPKLFRKGIDPVQRIKISPEILNVVWIGSASLQWHDFDLLIRTARLLLQKENVTNVQFHVIGSGMGSMSDMPVNISYYGAEDYEKLPNWLAAMDVGLVLYKEGVANYNSPLKLFDYMASGLAIVGTFQSQLKDICSEIGSDDLIVPPGNEHELARKLVWLLRNKEIAKSYGEKGRKLLVDKYTWKHNVNSIVDEINTLNEVR